MKLFAKTSENLSSQDKDLVTKVEILIQAVERVYPSTFKLMYRNFLSGIFFSLGTTIGLSIVLAALTFVLNQLQVIPTIGQFLQQYHIEISPKK